MRDGRPGVLLIASLLLACGRTASHDDVVPSSTSGAGAAVDGGDGGSTSTGGMRTSMGGVPASAGGTLAGEAGKPTAQFPPGTDPDAIGWYLAGQARGEGLCRCALGDTTPLQGCIDEETFAPNPICLSALAPPNPVRWQCLQGVLAEDAACYAQGPCNGLGQVPQCGLFPECPQEGSYVHAERICSKRYCGPSSLRLFARQFCDGARDCPDGADELNCTPGRGVFECTNGETVPISELCDTQQDCADYSDEEFCF